MTILVRPFACLCAIVLFAALPAAASVIDAPRPLPAAFLGLTAWSTDGGYWVEANQTETQALLLRHAVDGTLLSTRRIDGMRVISAGASDLLLVSRFGGPYLLERVKSDGTTRWRQRFSAFSTATIAGSYTWVSSSARLTRIDPDGTIGWSGSQSDQGFSNIYGLSDGSFVRSSTSGGAFAVTRIGLDGAIQWSVAPIAATGNASYTSASSPRSFVGVRSGSQGVQLFSVAPEGTVEYLVQLAPASISSPPVTGLSHDWLVIRRGGEPIVARVAHAGGVYREFSFPAGVRCRNVCPLVPLADGDAIVYLDGSETGPQTTRAFRMQIADDSVTEVPTPGFVGGAARISSSLALAFVRTDGTDYGIARIAVDGTLSAPLSVAAPPPASEVADSEYLDDGSVLLVQAVAYLDRHAVTLVAPDGSVRWSAIEPSAIYMASTTIGPAGACTAIFRAEGDRVLSISCRAIASGELRWTRTFAELGAQSFVRMRQLGDGTLVAWASGSPSGNTLLRLRADGSELSRATLSQSLVDITATGAIAVRGPGYLLSIVDANGTTISSFAGDATTSPEFLATDGNEFYELREQPRGTFRLRRFDATGRQSYDVDLGSRRPTVGATRDRALVYYGYAPASPQPSDATLIDASGNVVWRRNLYVAPFTGVRYLRNGDFALVYVPGNSAEVRVLDGATGRDVLFAEEECLRCAAIRDVSLGSDNVVRGVVSGAGTARTESSRLVSWPLPSGVVDLDARSISGAWYQPYIAGDGFVASFDAASRTMFAAWFTYGTPFAEGDAGLHWYTLQGTAPQSGPIELTIYENSGGTFAQPPITTPVAVGRATWRLVDCGNVELDYVFTAAPRFYGHRSLSRLTDPGNCAGAAPAPRAGLDWRQSGAWFDPSTAGQGILMSVSPDAGVFGAWFTYDAAGGADDPARQQWLTFQPAATPAPGATLAVDIYRTTGGMFEVYPATGTVRIGSGTLAFEGCSRATWQWRFDASRAAGALAGATGQQTLERLGACPP